MKAINKAIIIVGIAAMAITTTDLGLANADSQTKTIMYTVKPGDTLWHIAQIESPGEQNDIREVIYNISQRNGLGQGPLQVGQQIKLEIKR